MKKAILVLTMLFSFYATVVPASEVGLEKIVVTPYRYGEDMAKMPVSTTVISPSDIKNANARSILDVLRSVPGVVVRDFFGQTAKASVDIRGFGEQGAMNVLVLVDGRRTNEIDLSGVDWAQIPLSQVEKIEIIRGGAGSVLYGDNAVSGVINIITKKGKGKPRWQIETEGGSYQMHKEVVSLSGSYKPISYWLTASYDATDGYRKNSYFKSKDFATKLIYEIEPAFSLRFNQGFHDAGYGLPGALLSSDLERMRRRDTKYPRDHADDRDYYFVLGLTKKIKDSGEFSLDGSFRKKQVFSNFIDANAGWNPVYKSRIDTLGFTPKYTFEKNVLGHRNKMIIGIDYYQADYKSDNYDILDTLQNATGINKLSLGYYLQDEISLLKDLTFLGGWRYEAAKYEIDYYDFAPFPNPAVDTDIKPDAQACNIGLVYNYKDDSSLFFNFSQSFRFPAADEYYTWGTLNLNLKPQFSQNYELGLRHRFSQQILVGFNLFRMNLKNELYYNPLGGPWGWGANENYDKTCREGLELTFDSKLFKKISFFGSYTYINAFFISGRYDEKIVPMAPEHKGSLGLRFAFFKNINFNVLANYVGQRYFINDQANNFSPLSGYFTVGMNLAYNYKDFSATFGINNLFDKMYSEYGVYSTFAGQKGYYPSPGRNFYFRVKYGF